MCELVHCPGCGELISESLPISECLTCLSSSHPSTSPERPASASGTGTQVTLFILVVSSQGREPTVVDGAVYFES
ncbi:uncharacterized protein TrAtP1_001926 [Trichoderma atroviride]|uniref:uncharacterized protein n=1 Tax=Hypocrea atroviridis TaxID=63577 RepID=UPI00332CFF26|nr:hypothetical protein TrAtP1_001926 [Trichoderma atroviride]